MTTRKRASKGNVLPLTFAQRTTLKLIGLERLRLEVELARAQLELADAGVAERDADRADARHQATLEALQRSIATLVPLFVTLVDNHRKGVGPAPGPPHANGANGSAAHASKPSAS